MTGANLFREEWSGLLAELVEQGVWERGGEQRSTDTQEEEEAGRCLEEEALKCTEGAVYSGGVNETYRGGSEMYGGRSIEIYRIRTNITKEELLERGQMERRKKHKEFQFYSTSWMPALQSDLNLLVGE